MRNSTALVTDVAKAAAQATLDAYANGVAAHIGADWGAHAQINFINSQYISAAIGPVTTGQIRMLLTDGSTDFPIIVPATLLNSGNVSPGLPIITTQPSNLTVTPGSQAVFKVVALSSTPLTYSWRLNGVPTGGTMQTYTIPNATSGFAGLYDVVVTNSAGSVTSDPASLVVSAIVYAQPVFTPPAGIFHVEASINMNGSAPATQMQISQTQAFAPSPTSNRIVPVFTVHSLTYLFHILATCRMWARAGDGTTWSPWAFADYQKI